MSTSITSINNSECLDTSRVTINNNFKSLYETCVGIDIEQQNISNNNITSCNQFLNTLTTINKYITPYIHCIRLSLSPTNSISRENIVSDSIFLHPFNGSSISLYDNVFKTWFRRNVSVKRFNLISSDGALLPSNTNFDIFLYWDNLINDFALDFSPWQSTSNIDTYQGVSVSITDFSRRFIGCLRTTEDGKTETTYTDNHSTKVFLWNFKNRVQNITRCVTQGSYKNYKTFNDTPTESSWCRTAESTEKSSEANTSRMYFIVGSTTPVECAYQNFFNCEQSSTVCSSISIDSIDGSTTSYGTVCLTGCNTTSGIGNTTSILKGNVERGLHFIQSFDASNNTINFNTTVNTNTPNTVLVANILG